MPRLIHFLAMAALVLYRPVQIAADEPPPVTLCEDVVYGEIDGTELTLHLAQPAKVDKRVPALVFLHRGGWVGGSKNRYKQAIQDFAAAGYVAASVGYRFAPKHPFPAQIEDSKCAGRWLRAHAEDLGVDPQRIGAIGESAGGYLSMMLGVLDPEDGMEGSGGWVDQPSKVQAVVSFYGPSDLRWETIAASPYRESLAFEEAVARRLLKAYVGGEPEASTEILYRASPIKYVDRRDVPTMLIQGTSDPLVMPDQALMMTDALTKAGVFGHTELVFGLMHDWDGVEFFEPLARAKQFFDEQLKGSKPTTIGEPKSGATDAKAGAN